MYFFESGQRKEEYEQLSFFDVSRHTPSKQNFDDYEGFVEKFKLKKTTDDCYTPPLVYDAIAEWVEKEYGVNRVDFIRPFYPGGNYKSIDYGAKIVVDNPPFSILAEIIDFYNLIGVKFFLFAPLLTSMKHSIKNCCYICCDCTITYENGANVNTAFLTNLEPYEIMIRTAPELRVAVADANAKSKKERKPPNKPKYKYPPEVVSIALVSHFARHDVSVTIRRDELEYIPGLDSQRAENKAIFGGGFLTTRAKGAELEEARWQAEEARRQAEEARRRVWRLSSREWEIITRLEHRANEKK